MKINLYFADGKNGYGSEHIGSFDSWRNATRYAHETLAKYGTVRREHNLPSFTDRMWTAPGDRAVHAEVDE